MLPRGDVRGGFDAARQPEATAQGNGGLVIGRKLGGQYGFLRLGREIGIEIDQPAVKIRPLGDDCLRHAP